MPGLIDVKRGVDVTAGMRRTDNPTEAAQQAGLGAATGGGDPAWNSCSGSGCANPFLKKMMVATFNKIDRLVYKKMLDTGISYKEAQVAVAKAWNAAGSHDVSKEFNEIGKLPF
jgi:hypothetical protein